MGESLPRKSAQARRRMQDHQRLLAFRKEHRHEAEKKGIGTFYVQKNQRQKAQHQPRRPRVFQGKSARARHDGEKQRKETLYAMRTESLPEKSAQAQRTM